MLAVDIPGFGRLELDHLVLDYNGTLALDGRLVPGVARRLRVLAPALTLHVLTADTFGGARRALARLPCELVVLGAAGQAEAKARYVRRLGAGRTACVGNGRNDRLMLGAAALGIAVILAEGAASETVRAADVVAGDIRDALDLLIRPLRLAATLRS